MDFDDARALLAYTLLNSKREKVNTGITNLLRFMTVASAPLFSFMLRNLILALLFNGRHAHSIGKRFGKILLGYEQKSKELFTTQTKPLKFFIFLLTTIIIVTHRDL